ncbi:MAG: energy-coupling factor ABC transporter ATP-binding protein [Chloroflexota bacterium]|nr:energy-coupling factor ABC transporter ATP-binding protein [Chloroflexota bacterium]
MPITHPEVSLPPPKTKGDPTILVRDLRFRYPDGYEALRGISLALTAGEKVALVGPNGAGKSTFMLHLNGLLRGEGEIYIAGLPLKRETLLQIRGKVGLVFQNPDDQLFSPTVFDDVAFGPLHMGYDEVTVRERVAEALSVVGMSEYAARMPHQLSVGQKKRVAIATVLAMHPDILVLDEPSAGLDPRGRRQLINLLHNMSLTMLVSTHDMQLVRELFARTLVMDGGVLVRDAETDAILADDAFLVAHGLERP